MIGCRPFTGLGKCANKASNALLWQSDTPALKRAIERPLDVLCVITQVASYKVFFMIYLDQQDAVSPAIKTLLCLRIPTSNVVSQPMTRVWGRGYLFV